jgi:hypothetical protein
MAINIEKMLTKIKSSQWGLADIDWDAPGSELVTENPELFAKLKPFMADLMWIEHVGARGFAAMAKKAPNETLAEIYRYFHAEEQRHANAELALMQRWGMLDGDELPEPNINIRLLVEWLDTYADDQPLVVLGSVIPMLEIALDGALCKFLLETVDDPVCHEVFGLINSDESRHLTVDFHVLEMLGKGSIYLNSVKMLGNLANPKLMLGILAYVPLLSRMRDNVVGMGLKEEDLNSAMRKYRKIGNDRDCSSNAWFKLISQHSAVMVDRDRKLYHKPVDGLVKLSDYYPKWALKPLPTWFKQLSWRPTV